MDTIEIKLKINSKIFLRDPVSTKLGRRIIENSVILMDEIGLEDFSFRKLANKIASTESSVYRYFENKHYLFVYLLNWYWEWTSTRIDLGLLNINDPEIKLKTVIKTLIESTFTNADAPFIDEEILHRIVVREGSKAYHHKLVDKDNEYGFFLSYKNLCKKISNIILEINSSHSYPKSLASTLVETANNNIYFAKHLPRLTDLKIKENEEEMYLELFTILFDLAISNIKNTTLKTNYIETKQIKLKSNF